MRIIIPESFKKQYDNLSEAIQKKAKRQLTNLAENIRHPSLRAHKMKIKGRNDIWEARINLSYRITFELNEKENVCTLRKIGTHEIFDNP